MLYLRSLLFNAAFYLGTAILAIGGLPTMFAGRRAVLGLARLWAHMSLWLLETICGVSVEFRGLENLRQQQGCIIAAKHQSALETIALTTQVRDFAFILKRELTLIPLFGQYLTRSNQIAINRENRSSAMRGLMAQAGRAIAEGRAIFIFPEGTRRPAGAPPLYKAGVSYLYSAAKAPCIPVALNSGLFWPRRALVRRPGRVVIEFLPVISPGLPPRQFVQMLQDRIETASNRLIADALMKDPSLSANLEKNAPAAPAND